MSINNFDMKENNQALRRQGRFRVENNSTFFDWINPWYWLQRGIIEEARADDLQHQCHTKGKIRNAQRNAVCDSFLHKIQMELAESMGYIDLEKNEKMKNLLLRAHFQYKSQIEKIRTLNLNDEEEKELLTANAERYETSKKSIISRFHQPDQFGRL